MKRYLLPLLILAACGGELTTPPVPPAPSPPPAQPEIPISGSAVPGMEGYDKDITDVMQKYGIPGGAIAVVRGGLLPGTTSILVRSYSNVSWVALFNTRPGTGNLFGEVEAALGNALAQMTSFPSHDLFSTFR